MESKKSNKFVWYASYGSNLCLDRFFCYIRGGIPEGSSKMHEGCRDQTLPKEIKNIEIKRDLYFAKAHSSWGKGGVAFINNEKNNNASTLGRMYLITYDQFVDVVKQENNYTEELCIDFQEAIDRGNTVFLNNSWYGNLIYLGEERGYPIFTFTNDKYLEQEINLPGIAYLAILKKGVKESYGLDEIDTKKYFDSKIKS